MLHRSAILFAAGLVIAAVASCRSLPGSASRDSDASYQTLDAATQHYAAMLRGAPVDSVAAAFATDGELLLPGMAPLHGRRAIIAFLAPMAKSMNVVSVEMHADSERVAGSSAQQAGRYIQVAGPRGKSTQTYRGTYVALWRREGDGAWRIVRLTMRPAQ